MLVRFTRKVSPYNAGETAGFPEAEARRFVRLGAAVFVSTTQSLAAASVQGEAVISDQDIMSGMYGSGEAIDEAFAALAAESVAGASKAPANKQTGKKGR
ncbi:hypothetical protein [Solidesulfovibrio sp.]